MEPKQSATYLRHVARDLADLHSRKSLPRWAQWGLLVATLRRHFRKNPASTQLEVALQAIVKACDKEKSTNLNTSEVLKLVTNVAVAWHMEDSQENQIGKGENMH